MDQQELTVLDALSPSDPRTVRQVWSRTTFLNQAYIEATLKKAVQEGLAVKQTVVVYSITPAGRVALLESHE